MGQIDDLFEKYGFTTKWYEPHHLDVVNLSQGIIPRYNEEDKRNWDAMSFRAKLAAITTWENVSPDIPFYSAVRMQSPETDAELLAFAKQHTERMRRFDEFMKVGCSKMGKFCGEN